MIFKESDSSVTGESLLKKTPKQKVYTANKIRFFIGYFVYEIHGIKRMQVQKPI